jgi:nucleoid-associated protein YgaU
VTREHKLALIVGFSLILLVGVLISDHLSRARQAKIVPVGPGETQLADGTLRDPLRNTDGDTAVRALADSQPVAVLPGPGQNAPPAAPSPQPQATQGPTIAGTAGGAPAGPGGEPPRPRAEWTNPARPGNTHDALSREIASSNGYIDEKGIIHLPHTGLPPAAATNTMGVAAYGTSLAPRLAAQPALESPRTYTVQKGDTFIKIAERTYGTGKLWKQLSLYNKVPEGQLRVGQKISLPDHLTLAGVTSGRSEAQGRPSGPAAPSATSRPAAPRINTPAKPAEIRYATYTVRPGDTLGHISQRMLGTSRRVQDIIDLNKLDDEDAIPVGTVLRMPVKG